MDQLWALRNVVDAQKIVRFFREKYLKPHFVNVSREGEL